MLNRNFQLLFAVSVFLGIMACGLFSPTQKYVSPTPASTPTMLDTPVPPATGILNIEIQYTGKWYRETFGYEPDAPNIRHVVLVVPVDIVLDGAGWVFSGLEFAPYPLPFTMRTDRAEYATMLKYLYDTPGGTTSIELKPGRYNVAAAFLCAALPPPGGDVFLYPGVTGGGASNEFQEVEIVAGDRLNLSITLTDNNGWGHLPGLASR